MRTFLLLSTAAILALGVPASAFFECGAYGVDATGVWQLTSGSPDSTFYLDDRGYFLGNGIWIFEESNGIWTPKLPGVSHAASVVDHPDLQASYCSAFVPWCEGPFCSPIDMVPDRLLF